MIFSQSNQNSQQSDLNSQLSQLGKELISYRVVDNQTTVRATVTDIYYASDRSLNLLVKLSEDNNQNNIRLLEASQIRQLDLNNQLIFTNLSGEQMANLPFSQPTSATSSLSDQSPEIRESWQIPLWEEKLKVNRRQRKVGEVIVRKQVETRMVQVPVRQEKLIVERIGEQPEQLAEVVLSNGQVNGFEFGQLNQGDTFHLTKSQFLTVETAQKLLEAVANLSSASNAKIRLEIVTNDSQQQIEHQHICDRYK